MTDGNIGWEAPQAGQLSWQLEAKSQQPRVSDSTRKHTNRQTQQLTEIGIVLSFPRPFSVPGKEL